MTNIEIIQSFRQGGTGNCVAIALIKAGIEVFGVDQIFNHQFYDGGFKFMYRDGFESQVTSDELVLAIAASKFLPLNNQDVFKYANLCFAAMAKRAMIEGNDDRQNLTYQEALITLNDGEYYQDGPYWLGLQHNYRNIGRRYALNNPGCVAASKRHCFYVSYGHEDKYGTPDRIGILERQFVKWYRLTKEQIF